MKKKSLLTEKKHMMSKPQKQSKSQANRGNRKPRHLTEDYKHAFSNFSYRTKERNALVDTL